MKNNKKQGSLRLIYQITQIIFWIYTGAALLVTGTIAGIYLHLFGENLHVGISIPAGFELIGQGSLQLSGQTIPVGFTQAFGNISMPASTSLWGGNGLFLLTGVWIFFLIFKFFRSFIRNVYKGKIFEISNFLLLRKIAYGLLICWSIILLNSIFLYFFIVPHLHFDSMQLSGNIKFHAEILFIALFLMVLSRIFLHGIQLEEDQQFTI
ncbi:MAG: DUF2975 domain-containing protein [Bacteroidales bacterium]|nr:DUF2975 domain-containing protein [Bacteroidales bacterium]